MRLNRLDATSRLVRLHANKLQQLTLHVRTLPRTLTIPRIKSPIQEIHNIWPRHNILMRTVSRTAIILKRLLFNANCSGVARLAGM